jgi:hypothetical protein
MRNCPERCGPRAAHSRGFTVRIGGLLHCTLVRLSSKARMSHIANATLLCGALLVPAPSQAQERQWVDQSARAVAAELLRTRDVLQPETRVRLLGPLVVIGGRRPDTLQLTTPLKRCPSAKKRVLIGAAIGAVGGGRFGAYVDHRAVGSARGGVVLTFAAGGAGVGALVGLVSCR